MIYKNVCEKKWDAEREENCIQQIIEGALDTQFYISFCITNVVWGFRGGRIDDVPRGHPGPPPMLMTPCQHEGQRSPHTVYPCPQ